MTFKHHSMSPFDYRHSVSEVLARLDQGERRNAPDMDFSYNSALTLSFHLETWFNDNAHPLTKALWGWNMSQIGPSGEKMLQTWDRQTDGRMDWWKDRWKDVRWMDRQTNHYRVLKINIWSSIPCLMLGMNFW